MGNPVAGNPTEREPENDTRETHTVAAPSARTTLKRGPGRAVYEHDAIRAILDEALVCHVGFVYQGTPRVIPSAYARSGDVLYLHGATANRRLRCMLDGEVCIEVTLLDGLVLARSALHHSVNYRSVVIYGRGEMVTDPAEKAEALRLIVEHAIPGRSDDVRTASSEEVRQTLVVRIPIAEASAKVRAGGPSDEDEDRVLDCWAGVIPLRNAAQAPVDDELLREGISAPSYAVDYRRPGRGD